MQRDTAIKTIRNAVATFFMIAAGAAAVIAGDPPANDNFANAELLTGVRVSVVRSNVGASKEASEPNHASNAGGRSVWFKWIAPSTSAMTFSTGRTETNLNTILHIYTGATISSLASEGFSNDIAAPVNVRSSDRVYVRAGDVYYIAVDGFNSGAGAAAGPFALDIITSNIYQGADFDGDGLTDVSVFRPSNGTWYVLRSATGQMSVQHYGTNGDIPVVASRESQRTSPTVFRPGTGIWYGYQNQGDVIANWGSAGDIPVAATFGNEEASNYTVFRPSTGVWYGYGHGAANYYFHFGINGDIPVPGRYTPDMNADPAVYRPSTGVWYILQRVSNVPNENTLRAVQFGLPGDKPVPGDYDGDGLLDPAIYRPSTGTWWMLRSSDNQQHAVQFGLASDVPTTGDFDGDGKFDFAVFRPSTGDWYILNSNSQFVKIVHFGTTGDIPMTSNLRH